MDIQTLFARYHDEIYRYLWRLCRDDLLTQDLTQETFLKALQHLGKLPPDSHYRAWLYRIATNTHHDHWRKHQRNAPVEWNLDLIPADENLEQSYERGELLTCIWGRVQQLPLKQRQALILSRYQLLDHAEIATCLNISEESVRANLYLALKKLRQQFKETTE